MFFQFFWYLLFLFGLSFFFCLLWFYLNILYCFVFPPFLVYQLYSFKSYFSRDFPGGSDGKASAYNVGDWGSIPGSGRSPGEGSGHPLHYSCLENPMDGGACYSPWGRKALDTTERLHSLTHSLSLLYTFAANLNLISNNITLLHG